MEGNRQMLKSKNFWGALGFALALSIILYFIYPLWQLILPIGFIAGLIANNHKYGFSAPFFGIFIGWLLLILFQSLNNPTIGSAKLLAGIIGLGGSLWPLIIFLTILIGALIAGLSGLVGAYIRTILKK